MFEGSAAAPLELPRQEPGMRDARQASARLICLVRDQGLPVVGAGAELPVASVADGLAARGAPADDAGAGAPMGDAPEGEHAPRASHLRSPQGHRRAGLRPDQTGHWLPTLLAARVR